jgi:mono/diheme cytochrome c family protein
MKLHAFPPVCLVMFSFLAVAAIPQAPAKNSAANSAPNKDPESVYAALNKAPEKNRAKPNPLANDPQAVAAGRILFAEHCQECHGRNAEGTKKAPSLRAGEVQDAAPGAIFWVLSNGVVRRGMPVWSKLPEPQRWQLVSYIKSLGAANADPATSSTKP